MALIDEIKKHCPYCGLEGTIKQFIGWEEGGKRGYQGQTCEGLLIIVCPRCGKRIRYDIAINKFLTFAGEEPPAVFSRNRFFPWFAGLMCFCGSLYFILSRKEWWGYLAGALLFVYGWISLKGAAAELFKNVGKPRVRRTFFKKSNRKLEKRS